MAVRRLLGAAMAIGLLVHSGASAAASKWKPGTVTTIAGSVEMGYKDGRSKDARFRQIFGITVDPHGDVYLSDTINYRIRKLSVDGTVSTVAGSGKSGFSDGPKNFARFAGPQGIAVDRAGNIYVADPNNNRIRKIDARGTVTTFAGSGEADNHDGVGIEAQFSAPTGVAFDRAGNLFVADNLNHRIRKIDSEGNVVRYAGKVVSSIDDSFRGFQDGPSRTAEFANPIAVAVDQNGVVFVADHNNCRVRKIANRNVTTLGKGRGGCSLPEDPKSDGQFNKPTDVEVDSKGNVYVADIGNYRIQVIDPSGDVSTIAGSGLFGEADGIGKAAQFRYVYSIALDPTERYLYVADENRVRRVELRPKP